MQNIMSINEQMAEENRSYFRENHITVFNVMASPGSGKTSVIRSVIKQLAEDIHFSVIEGDIASSIDAQLFAAMGISALQINTGGGCHLDANMIRAAVRDMELPKQSILFIENVGNLICPSSFDLGESIKMVIASVPEGHDKPYKYISMFEGADLIILNKLDLAPYIDFDKKAFMDGVRALNERAPIFEISCRTGQGVSELADWLGSFHREKTSN